MVVRYKKKCLRCKKNYVSVTWRQGYTICWDCQKGELVGEIKDPKMKKLFKIPESYYKENHFLRNIKSNYLRYERLTEKQIAAFKKTIERIKEAKKQAKAERY